MTSLNVRRERAVLDILIPQLEEEGFEVFVYPTQNMLPPFLRPVPPDAIAYKGDQKLAIEIQADLSSPTSKAAKLREALDGHPDWEFRLVYAPSSASDAAIPPASYEAIEAHLAAVENAVDHVGTRGALLLAWAGFEAAARALEPENFARPQNPARLLEALASDGSVTPDEADTLRRLGAMRNEIAHGRLDLEPTRADVDTLVTITRTVLGPRD